MDQTLLVEQIDDARTLIDRLVRDGFDVAAAAWVRPGEEGRWLLYLASKEVERDGLAAAYRAVHPTLTSLRPDWVTLTELRLVGPSDPVALGVLELNESHPDGPAYTRGPLLGGVAIEGAYVFPPPGPPS